MRQNQIKLAAFWSNAARDVLLGMAVFPILMFAGWLPVAVNNGLLLAAWNGVRRFTLGDADTINAARVLCFGAVGSFGLFLLPRKQGLAPVFLAPCLGLGLIVLVLLTANRQYLLTLFAFPVFWVFLLETSRLKRLIVGGVSIVFMGLVTYDVVTSGDVVLKDRITADALAVEISEARGPIWADAFQTMLAHPILGTGFKNYGAEVDMMDRSGNLVIGRDSAHGVFQDVFTEHGIILGMAFLAGCVHLLMRSWRDLQQTRWPAADKALTAGMLALSLPLTISAGFLNATPVYVLLLLAMARDSRNSGHALDPIGGHVRANTAGGKLAGARAGQPGD